MSQERVPVHYEEDANGVKYDMHARRDPYTTTRVITTQKDSAMAEALLLEPPRFWSRTTFTLFACLFVTYLCSAQNGFDSNTFGGVSAMPNFKAQFGTNIAATNGFLAALYVIGESQFSCLTTNYIHLCVGNVIGSFAAGPCADRWGRKPGMFIASGITLIGAICQASAEKRRDLIAGRIVLGVGAVMLGPSAQSWAVGGCFLDKIRRRCLESGSRGQQRWPIPHGEVSWSARTSRAFSWEQVCDRFPEYSPLLGPKQSKPVISTWVEYGLAYLNNGSTINWRLPMALQGLPAILVMTFVWFIPESPRWYIAQGEDEKAKEILVK